LGIETLGQVATPLIPRNTTIPTSKSQIFSTAADNQTQVEINILQGERPMAFDNKTLGRFILDGLPPAPRGVPQIEVTFDLDANGILNVTAKDKATNKEQSIKITGSTGLAKDEVEKMTKEAEAHAAEDTQRKEQIEARNVADNLVYTAEKTLKDAGEKVKPEDKKKVEEEITKVKDVLKKEGATKEEIEEATKVLSEAVQQVGAAMYGSQQKTEDGGQKAEGRGQKTESTEAKPEEPDKEKAKGPEPVEGAEEGEVVE